MFALVFGIVFSLPSITQSEQGKKITLGLDLQGGLHMLLGIKSEVAIKSTIKSMAATINYAFNDEDIIFNDLKITDEEITFEILDKDELLIVKKMLKKDLPGTVITENNLKFKITLTEKVKENIKTIAIEQAVDTIRNRLNEFGLAEPTVAKQGTDKILVEVPGIKTQADEKRIRELIARAAHLQMMRVDEDRAKRTKMSPSEAKSYGDVILMIQKKDINIY
jgi:preprotein translocase subunit SecD